MIYMRDVKSIISFRSSEKWAIKHEHGEDVILDYVKKNNKPKQGFAGKKMDPSFGGVADLFGPTLMHEHQPKSQVDINGSHLTLKILRTHKYPFSYYSQKLIKVYRK